MAEGPRAAVPALAELHDCVPQRDYARPATPHYDAGEESPSIRWHDAGKASTPYLVACVQVLLARQIDRAEVAVGLRSTEDGFGFRIAAATVFPNRSFARIVSEFSSRPAGDIGGDLYIPGAVVEVRHATGGDTQAQPAPMAADLGFRFERGADGLSVTLAYNRLLYRQGTIASLARQLTHMVSSLSPESQTDSQLVSLLDHHEFHRVVHGFNDNRVRFPSDDYTLSDLIEAQARRTPDDCCVVHGTRRMTYRELDTASARLATLLRSLGVGPGRFVAILDHRGPDFVVAMLAIWKAGGAYVPIDPAYPESRVRYMLEDSESPVVLVGSASMLKFARIIAGVSGLTDAVCLQAVNLTGVDGPNRPRVHGIEEWRQGATTGPGPKAKASDPAYMIYTSGSTGRPKGAIVRHDGAVNHLFAQARSLGIDGIRRFLQTAPSSSDISVWQFAAPLVFGGVTAVVDDVTDVENILTQVRRHDIQVIELVPVVMRFLVDYAANLPAGERALPSLRWAMVTGESASVELVNAWLSVYPHTPVVNAYGPTEAADDVAQAILAEPLPSNQLTVPIGRSLANMDVYVLDDRLYPVPIGAVGEICVAGVGVGNGYWRRPEQTRQCFVPNPFAGAAGTTIYRTGDMGRLLDDGTLECLGRRDHQVQLRGFRIELQEIEAVLCAHPAISVAAAQVFRDGSGDGRLVAYVVFKPGDAPEPPALRSWLAERLPPAMVPSSLVPLEQLPLNPAGKIDRNALRPPDPSTSAGPLPSAATQGSVESILVALWQQELGIAAVGPDDDFFDLGGDSLSALGIVVGARAAGLRLRPGDILQHPTVARLAQVVLPIHQRPDPDTVRREPASASSIRGLTDSERSAFLERENAYEAVYPLTPPQQGIFMHWLLARDKTAYVDQYSFTLTGPLSPTAFEQAWEHIATRHPVLRTAFLRSVLSEPAQAVLRRVALDFEFVDHAHLDAAVSGQALHQLMTDAVQQGFAVARPPLSRVTLVRLAADLHRLVWTHHHIVVDGWSMSIVLSEVLQAHAALSANRAIQLPAAQTYGRYVAWLQQHDISASEAFWRESLAGFTGAPPFSVAPPQEPRSGYEQIDIGLAADIGDLLARRARSYGVTLTTLLLAAWACLLSRHTGSDDVVFGMVASGRELELERIDDIVGLFVTTLPLRIDAGRAGDVGDWLRTLQRKSAAAREHADVSLSQILRWSTLEPGRTLLDTLFVMSNYPGIEESAQGPLQAELAEFRTVPAYPMSLIVSPGRTLGMRLVYDCRRFDAQAVAALAGEYAGLLDCLAQGRDPRNAA